MNPSSLRTTASRIIFTPLLYRYWKMPVFEKYRYLIKHEHWSHEQLLILQREKLTHLLQYAFLNIPYYNRVLAEKGLKLADISGGDALSGFPVLTKKIIQDHHDEIVNPNILPQNYVVEHSGGSTGQPTRVRRNLDARAEVHAATWRVNRWIGWDVGDSWMWLWGRLSTTESSWKTGLVKAYKEYAMQEAFFNIHGLNKEKLLRLAEKLNAMRPKLLVGYTNVFYHLCLLAREEKIALPHPLGVATTAETLFPEQRKVIETVLGCKIFNRYASSEVGLIAAECEYHDGFHITMENVYVECVQDDGSPAPPGAVGKLLITDLNNRAMPLIRYELGDIGALATSPCRCGRPFQRLEKVTGRLSDVLRLPGGKIVFPDDLAEIFYPLDPVEKFQVIQEEQDRIIVNIVMKGNSDPQRLYAIILEQLQEAVGKQTRVTLNFVEDIPILPSGKHRICISKLK